MAEYIEREALSKWLHETMSAQTTTVGMACVRDFWNKVLDTPAADVVPVVQCGKCVFWNGGLCSRKMLGLVRPEDFCSFGKRRMDGDTDG